MARHSAEPDSPWYDTTGWRLNENSSRQLFFRHRENDDKTLEQVITEYKNHFIFHSENVENEMEVIAEAINNDRLRLLIDNSWQRFRVLQHGTQLKISWQHHWYELTIIDPFENDAAQAGTVTSINAPMPGMIYKLFVSAGEKVSEGQALAIIEAMKMEHTLTAPADRIIDEVFYQEGDFVEAETILITFADDD
jgi:3-methylcrotonyl-CoA carboxylase alpha subunit